MIRIVTLFSGSKGNCTLVSSDSVNILIDAGLQYNKIVSQLKTLGLGAEDISAIVVTHEHTDHISGLAKWCRLYNTPIYAHTSLVEHLYAKCCVSAIGFCSQFVVGDMVVTPLQCSHDALSCHGYMLCDGTVSVASITDTGFITDDTVALLCQCRTVVLESNYDSSMLDKGKYRYTLKQRIISDKGHLSNKQAGNIITRLLSGKVVNIVLAHLSENNNTHELAFASAMDAIVSCGRIEGRDVHLFIAEQYNRGEVIE